MRRLHSSLATKAILLGLLTAGAGLTVGLSPLGLALEESIGLSWLFKLRGPRLPPDEVTVVSIDKESARRLGLRNEPRKWPRSLHAQLVRNLANYGAAVIAFDVIFEESRDSEDDRLFAQAIREAGNVVLFEYLKRETLVVGQSGSQSRAQLNIEQRVPPVPILADAAFGLAPFPLPKVPARVSQFWVFKPGAGETPTLPAVALQVFALPAYGKFLEILAGAVSPEVVGLPADEAQVREQGVIQDVVARLRQVFTARPELADELFSSLEQHSKQHRPEVSKQLASLVALYAGIDSRYINYYGPPHSIRTVPYYRLLTMAAQQEADLVPEIAGKAVFVGFSEQLQPEQKDGFYTVFSSESGLDISGVEIAATAFANLLERRSVQLLEPLAQILVLALWGFSVGSLLRLVPGLGVIPSGLLMGTLYGAAAHQLFILDSLWLPLVVPLLVQLPVAILGATLWKYLDVRRERENIRKAFGYHLPDAVVDRLATGIEGIETEGQQLYGICLATDAAQYTALSERSHPAELRDFMNRYFKAVFAPVRKRRGVVADAVGDSMLAIWASSRPEIRLREQACRAAIDILEAVDTFNRSETRAQLPTRIGLHCGEVLMGHVGALDHYEYRAVGGIVSTATRIEGLNKQIGTRLLVSGDMLHGLERFAIREIGTFVLAGKTEPLVLHELLSRDEEADVDARKLALEFRKALTYFRAGRWEDARAAFDRILGLFGRDPPSTFYREICKQYEQSPPGANWDGVLRMQAK